MIKIAVDAMGGDYAPKEQIEGAMLAVKNIKDIEITLYGDEEIIKQHLTNNERINIVHADGPVIDMGEKDPIGAIKNNPNSSMAMSLKSVKKKENDAVVSSGATQALIVGAHILVGRLKPFKRTAIAPIIPSIDQRGTILLDTGANLTISAQYMYQQAVFAAIYAKEVMGRENPKVGLANIGEEEGKGRDLEKEVYELFSNSKDFEFVGNVEPKVILDPGCDILIGDGYTMDMVMKTLVGTAKGMGTMLKQELKRNIFGMIGALIAKRNLEAFKKRMSADEVGGAMIYGLRGVVVKAQGSSNRNGFASAIRQAAFVVRNDVLKKVQESLIDESA